MLEELEEIEPTIFGNNKDWWTFDGDTIEFMTQNFYNTSINDVINELCEYKQRWLTSLTNGLATIGVNNKIQWPLENYGFARFATNYENIAIFNNGTYHINITVPTYLDKDCEIVDKIGFEYRHKQIARMFQWLSPILIIKYGSPDILSKYQTVWEFPKGTQRGCASRYISIGTYDTDIMEKGKLLTKLYERQEGRWIEKIYDNPRCAYKILPAIGFDINYNKHWNHGLEFRIFDWFPEEKLTELMKLIIWMCDEALSWSDLIPKPQDSQIWNAVVARCVWEGNAVILTEEELREFGTIFGILFRCHNINDIFTTIWRTWSNRWKCGECTIRMITEEKEKDNPVECSEVEIVENKKRWCC
jgi:hypothetical protein